MLTKARLTSARFLLLFAAGLVMGFVGLLPFSALASGTTDLTGSSQNVGSELLNIPKLIAVISYVIGTVFAARSLFALKGFIEKPDDTPITIFIGFATVSALLILLPYSVGVSQNALHLQTADIYSTSTSFEQKTQCTNDNSINKVFCTLAVQFSPFAQFLAVIAYVMAASLTLTGLLNLKAYGDDPSQTPLRSIIMKFVIAAMFLSLPFAMQVFVTSVTGAKSISTQVTIKKPALYRH